jgi:hypothetical protein
MIACCLRYVIDPFKLHEFEQYAKSWLPLVARFGGIHHGYFLPSEGANNIALSIFSFASLSAYEEYRKTSAVDPDVIAARKFAEATRCYLSYERTFFRPLTP